jgi:hypothetical protein
MLRTLAAALLAALSPSGASPGEAVAAAARAPAEAARAAPGREDGPAPRLVPEGRIDSPGTRVEILGKPVRVGEDRVLPEGYIRVEEAGTEDREVGSFSIVPAPTLRPSSVARGARATVAAPGAGVRQEEGGPATPSGTRPATAARERPCRGERAAYLRELWKTSGIEVADPGAVIDGLDSGGGSSSGFYWFALATDPFRPLAWSSALRGRADALARCVRDERPN